MNTTEQPSLPGTDAAARTRRSPANALRAPMHAPGETQHEGTRDAAHENPRRTRTRQHHVTEQDNPFDIPQDEIPEGSSYEWKRYSVSGESADHNPFYIASMRRQGWEPVDPKRHPNWIPPGYDKPYIIREGLILMERPIELTLEARVEVQQMTKRRMRDTEERLGLTPKNTGPRDDPRVAPRVSKEMVRPIPIEDSGDTE